MSNEEKSLGIARAVVPCVLESISDGQIQKAAELNEVLEKNVLKSTALVGRTPPEIGNEEETASSEYKRNYKFRRFVQYVAKQGVTNVQDIAEGVGIPTIQAIAFCWLLAEAMKNGGQEEEALDFVNGLNLQQWTKGIAEPPEPEEKDET